MAFDDIDLFEDGWFSWWTKEWEKEQSKRDENSIELLVEPSREESEEVVVHPWYLIKPKMDKNLSRILRKYSLKNK